MDIKYCLGILISICIFSCKKSASSTLESKAVDDIKLASYKSATLYKSDLLKKSILLNSDSVAIPHSEIEHWLMDQILLGEATEKLTNKNEIEALVDDYRNSLLIHHYENRIIAENLDSSIHDDEFIKYYQSNKAEYKLDDTYVRLLFLKVNKPVKEEKSIIEWMNNINSTNLYHLKKYCDNNAEQCFLNPDTWIKWKDIQSHVPSKFINANSLSSGLERSFADFKQSYFIKIIEVIKPNQDPPISYIKEKATRSILHQRKNHVLDNIKRQLYDKELNKKSIKFYQN
jgi:hypothetical protein